MRYALMIEAQQGCSYSDQLALALRAEAAGFETFLRSDHYDSFPGEAGRPTTDAWAVLAGLARETRRIRLGAMQPMASPSCSRNQRPGFSPSWRARSALLPISRCASSGRWLEYSAQLPWTRTDSFR